MRPLNQDEIEVTVDTECMGVEIPFSHDGILLYHEETMLIIGIHLGLKERDIYGDSYFYFDYVEENGSWKLRNIEGKTISTDSRGMCNLKFNMTEQNSIGS